MPAVTHQIWQNNQKLPAGDIRINLVGTAVGNGLTDPSIQYKYYAQMAVSTNHHKASAPRSPCRPARASSECPLRLLLRRWPPGTTPPRRRR